jgi:hypothetical protein
MLETATAQMAARAMQQAREFRLDKVRLPGQSSPVIHAWATGSVLARSSRSEFLALHSYGTLMMGRNMEAERLACEVLTRRFAAKLTLARPRSPQSNKLLEVGLLHFGPDFQSTRVCQRSSPAGRIKGAKDRALFSLRPTDVQRVRGIDSQPLLEIKAHGSLDRRILSR